MRWAHSPRPTSRLRRMAIACAVAAVVGWSVVGAAQDPEPPAGQEPGRPVFRAGAEFVSVDAFPRRDGKVVEGLTASDFQVLEDGTPQTIESFEFVRIEASPLDDERRDPTSQADGDRQAADPRSRVFVVYLDLSNITFAGGHEARRPVADFLARTIGARDLFGVMTAETPVSQLVFGRRLEMVEADLAELWTWGRADRMTQEPRTPAERMILECALMFEARTGRGISGRLLDLHRQDQLAGSLENLMGRLGSLRDERKNVLFISEGWVPRGPADDLANASVSQGDLPGVGVGPGGQLGLGKTMQPTRDSSTCDGEIARLAGIDFEARFRQLLRFAQESNVTFYPIDVGGLRTSAPLGGAVDTLRTLAENTDGFAIVGTNDLTGAVRRIESDLSTFYLLGYYSTNSVANGRFRRIDVKVNVPDVDVSARRGYFAMTPEMAEAVAAGPRAAAGPNPVDEALGRLASVRADADLFVAGSATPDGVDVAVELASGAIRREGWAEGTSVDLQVQGSAGSVVTVRADIAAGQRSSRLSIPADQLGPGPWQVLARAEGRDGRIEQQSEVAAPGEIQIVGSGRAYRGGRSLRSPLTPVADFRLSRLERLRVDWPILVPPDSQTARLLDRSGEPLGQNLPFTELPAEASALAVDLPLGSLPEGDYIVELVATRGDTTERRLLAFSVVR